MISSEILGLSVALNSVAMYKILSRCHTNAWRFYSGVSVQETLLYWLGAYKVYVQPILEYCSPVWSPYVLHEVEDDEIEKVQRYFTHRLQGLKSFSYTGRLFLLDLESLELRRLKANLTMYFKILHKLVDISVNDLFEIRDISHNTRGHSLTLHCSNIKNNLMKNSFVNRHINYCWNSLPNCVVHANSFGAFKMELDKINL